MGALTFGGKPVITKLMLAATAAAMLFLALEGPVSARACKRVCVKDDQGVFCYYDCSKIPGQPVLSK